MAVYRSTTKTADQLAKKATKRQALETNLPRDVRSIELVTPSLPPVHDAIGEYTERLAATIAKTTEVRILVGEQSKFEVEASVEVDATFCLGAAGLRRLRDRLVATTADAVVIQYNPFGWGRRGWAPGIVLAARALKKSRPAVRLGVMFHETFMMNPGWKAWAMRRYQVTQFHRLAEAADVCFFSTEVWADQERNRRPAARVIHLPVGSNLPQSEADPLATRDKLGVSADAFVVGAFGGGHPSRRFDWIRSGVEHIATRLAPKPVVILHVGGRGDELPCGQTPLIATGRLPTREAADAIATMDLMLNPFLDGVSTRRGSAIAALQQGTPVVSTSGTATDRLWSRVSNEGVYLADSPKESCWVDAIDHCLAGLEAATTVPRSKALRFHDQNFAWSRIAETLMGNLKMAAS